MPVVKAGAPVAIQRTPPRRVAAAIALVAAILMPVAVIEVLFDDLAAMVAALAAVAISAYAGWHALTRRRLKRWAGLVGALVAIGMLSWLLVDHDALPELIAFAVLAVLSISASRLALGPRRDLSAYGFTPVERGRPVPPADAGVLFLNPLAGRGKVERLSLADEARDRGIEPVVFDEGDDLEAMAHAAVDDGADVLGVAGGDGSQARVANVAMQRDVPFVCVPAGTRNHLALDLGIDRTDVVGALDAYIDGVERRVDLGRVNDRVFVNNVSLGMYARMVQSSAYRESKFGAGARLLPELFAQHDMLDLRYHGPDGSPEYVAQLLLISNNAYFLESVLGFGSRPRLDAGELGVVAVRLSRAMDLAQLVALDTLAGLRRYPGWQQWTATSFEVESGAEVEAGIDGEAAQLLAPLHFEALPGALRVRISRHHPGVSAAATAPSLDRRTFGALVRAALGRPTKPPRA